MKRLSICLALVLPWALPRTALAQDAAPAMAEDIEIMRRLLTKELVGRPSHQCASCHQQAFWSENLSPYALDWLGREHHNLSRRQTAEWFLGSHFRSAHGSTTGHASVAEGIYLKGYGVVYTVSLPPEPHEAIPVQVKLALKPTSDWERIRKEMRGEKVEVAAEVKLAGLPSLADTLLNVLAKNGRNFTQLAKDEKLTVVVTYRSSEQKAEKAETLSRQAKDLEAQGDLHLRKGNVKEAVAAYESGLKGSSTAAAQKVFYRKLAQAYFQSEDPRSIEYMKKYEEAKAAPTTPPAQPWPRRLIISATKEQLDRVGAGTITLEDFRRAASVEQQPEAAKEKKEEKK